MKPDEVLMIDRVICSSPVVAQNCSEHGIDYTHTFSK
jgi:hypothetical protein